MRDFFIKCILSFISSCLITGLSQGTDYIPEEILIKFIDLIEKEQRISFEEQWGLTLLKLLPMIKVYHYRLPENHPVLEAVEKFNSDLLVEFTEPNYIRSPQSLHAPNDPYYHLQWSLNNTGQEVNGVTGPPGIDIDWEEAMQIYQGDSIDQTRVAVIDSGVDLNHLDISPSIFLHGWDGDNEDDKDIDDDGNGYIDDVNGWDFYDHDNDPQDENGHGTLVASIIAGELNNSTGIAGISPDALIIPIRILSDLGEGNISELGISDLLPALAYAKHIGAKMINLSMAGGAYSYFEDLTFQALDEAGILVVVAAGNGGLDDIGDDNDLFPDYPSSYPLNNIISVAALDRSGHLAYFSNYGATSVDIAAPGTAIVGADIPRSTLLPEYQIQIKSGTSFSTPMVTGVAALIWEEHNNLLTHYQVRDLIFQNTDYSNGLYGKITTNGRLNAYKTLQATYDFINSGAYSPALMEGLEATNVLAGYGEQVGSDISFNGNVYDQILMTGPWVVVDNYPGQIVRTSFMDKNDDIVQVEFSGKGYITIRLDPDTYKGPQYPQKYNQSIAYVKGRAAIAVTSSDETTNISVHTVGEITSPNTGLFPFGTVYDGMADIRHISIDGDKIGSILCANARFTGPHSNVGISAASTKIENRLVVGDIDARGSNSAWLEFHKDSPLTSDGGKALIAGGDLVQSNGWTLMTEETKVKSTAGTKSDGTFLPARKLPF